MIALSIFSKKFIKVFIVILIIFFVTRLIILSSVLFIKQEPISPDCESFKWVADKASIFIPYKFNKVIIYGDAPEKLNLKVYINENHLTQIQLDEKTNLYCIDVNVKYLKKRNELRFIAEQVSGDVKDRSNAWRVWDLKTDKNINKSILRDQNLMFTQEIDTIGFSGSRCLESKDSLKRLLFEGLSKWDANMYSGIINMGYKYNGNNTVRQNIVFPYMYPLAGYAIKEALKCNALWAGVLINNLCFFVSLFFIYFFAERIIRDELFSYLPVVLLCVHPFSIFLVSAYSEGMFILFASISICLLYFKKYKTFPIFAGALGAIRMVGAVIPAILIYDYFVIQKKGLTLKNLFKIGTLSLFSLWGLITFMLYSAFRFGDPAAMFKNQRAWTPGAIKFKYILKHFAEPFVSIYKFMEPEILGMGLAVFIILFAVYFIVRYRDTVTRLEYLLAVFTVLLMLIPVVFYNKSPDIHPAMGRYTLGAFPVFILSFSRFNSSKIIYSALWISFSVFALVLMTIRFAWGCTPY